LRLRVWVAAKRLLDHARDAREHGGVRAVHGVHEVCDLARKLRGLPLGTSVDDEVYAWTVLQGVEPAAPAAPQKGWTCKCGAVNTGKFCTECGASQGWVCGCGAVNKGKFCSECGAKKPAGVPQYRCDKCGWQPADPTKAPKFCPECGDPFDSGDIV
jgi:membrane protease subunit (stomatin/prohibitin family)